MATAGTRRDRRRAFARFLWRRFLADKCFETAGALSYTTLFAVVPLLAWRRPSRALLLAATVSLFYFCHGVAEAYAEPAERVLASGEIALAVIVILACARMPKRRRTANARL